MVHARCRVKVTLHHTYVALRMRGVVRHLHDICAIHNIRYTLYRTVCMIVRNCLWSGLSVQVRVKVRAVFFKQGDVVHSDVFMHAKNPKMHNAEQ